MKTTLRAIAALVLAVLLLSYVTNYDYLWGGIGETWLRGWENAQIDDLQFRDHVRTIPASSNPQPWPEGPKWGRVAPDEVGQAWLENSETASFLVIQHDSLVYEAYFKGHDATTLTNSFSMVKSVTAMAIGLAVREGLVDEQAHLSEYLPRFANGESAGLTVQEVLQMRSNIPFGESYKDPFGFQAKAYYRDGNRALLEPYRVDGTPGTEFHYQGETPCCSQSCLTRFGKGTSARTLPTACGSKWARSTMRFGVWMAMPPTGLWSVRLRSITPRRETLQGLDNCCSTQVHGKAGSFFQGFHGAHDHTHSSTHG